MADPFRQIFHPAQVGPFFAQDDVAPGGIHILPDGFYIWNFRQDPLGYLVEVRLISGDQDQGQGLFAFAVPQDQMAQVSTVPGRSAAL